MVVLCGHRGAAGEAPENTVTGFNYAKRIGVTDYELDVYLSADNQLVVMHNNTVDHTTNGTGPVESFTVAELRQLDARAAFPDWPEPAWVPTLDEVLEVLNDCRSCQIEIKATDPAKYQLIAEKFVEAVTRYNMKDRVYAISFEAQALEAMRSIAPEIERLYIGDFNSIEYIETAQRLGCIAAGINQRTSSADIVKKVQDAQMIASGWIGDTQEQLDKLLEWGVDWITSNVPSFAMRYLQEHLPVTR
ncbi:MAG TPA: glycerophosphodiester phosphodiesterase family protein [Armatimonadota bacterium]|nr:glycerophosphodiester phosphodiesterase family protein [Armatimonadota bacterium]